MMKFEGVNTASIITNFTFSAEIFHAFDFDISGSDMPNTPLTSM